MSGFTIMMEDFTIDANKHELMRMGANNGHCEENVNGFIEGFLRLEMLRGLVILLCVGCKEHKGHNGSIIIMALNTPQRTQRIYRQPLCPLWSVYNLQKSTGHCVLCVPYEPDIKKATGFFQHLRLKEP